MSRQDAVKQQVEMADMVSTGVLRDMVMRTSGPSEHPFGLRYHPGMENSGWTTGPWLWWNEENASSVSDGAVNGEKVLLDFCRLEAASDQQIFQFASEHGILGIWPISILLPPGWEDLDRMQRYVFDREFEQEFRSVRQSFRELRAEDLDRFRISRPPQPESNRCFFNTPNPYADAARPAIRGWFGEPLSLWRRIAVHFRTMLLIAADLHSGRAASLDLWKVVSDDILLAQMAEAERQSGLTPLQAQQEGLAELCSRWMRVIWWTPTATPLHGRGQRSLSAVLKINPISQYPRWTDDDYESCIYECAWNKDLRRSQPYYGDPISDPPKLGWFTYRPVTMRPGRLVGNLVLALSDLLTSSVRTCSVCGTPTPGLLSPTPDGYRRRANTGKGIQCSPDCKREATLATKRKSWYKRQAAKSLSNS